MDPWKQIRGSYLEEMLCAFLSACWGVFLMNFAKAIYSCTCLSQTCFLYPNEDFNIMNKFWLEWFNQGWPWRSPSRPQEAAPDSASAASRGPASLRNSPSCGSSTYCLQRKTEKKGCGHCVQHIHQSYRLTQGVKTHLNIEHPKHITTSGFYNKASVTEKLREKNGVLLGRFFYPHLYQTTSLSDFWWINEATDVVNRIYLW